MENGPKDEVEFQWQVHKVPKRQELARLERRRGVSAELRWSLTRIVPPQLLEPVPPDGKEAPGVGWGGVRLALVFHLVLLFLGQVPLLVEHAPLEESPGQGARAVNRMDAKVRPLDPVDYRNAESFPGERKTKNQKGLPHLAPAGSCGRGVLDWAVAGRLTDPCGWGPGAGAASCSQPARRIKNVQQGLSGSSSSSLTMETPLKLTSQ